MQTGSPLTASSTAEALQFSTLAEWLVWQEALHGTEIELGLDRCRQVAANLSLLEPGFAVVSVAGTNGKGSSVAMLDNILRKAGYRTGKYTSPHLIRYNERVQIDGFEASDEALCRAFDRINRARGDISLTYFEFGTLAALVLFREAGVDIAVLEVGLGGRLDAVNILDADVALVTSIDLDHQNWLGSTRDLIAIEKAGIFRSGRPAVCSDPAPPQSLVDYAADLGTELTVLKRDFHTRSDAGEWTWSSGNQTIDHLPNPDPFNSCQIQNAAGVLTVLQQLAARFPVPDEIIRSGLAEFRLNGRFQVLPGELQYVLDVAHNQQAATVLLQNLRKVPAAGRTHVVIGMLHDKDRLAIFRILDEIASSWHTVSLCNSRGTEAETLAAELHSLDCTQPIYTHASVADALAAVRASAATGDRVLVTGSFLTVGAALNILESRNS